MKRLILFSLLVAHTPAFAQKGLDPADILKSLSDQWTTYSGDYTGKRYSSLKAINASTVNRLSLSWVSRFATGCGPTGSAATAEAAVSVDAAAANPRLPSSLADSARAI